MPVAIIANGVDGSVPQGVAVAGNARVLEHADRLSQVRSAMTTKHTAAEKRFRPIDQADLEPRTTRALTEPMITVEEAPDVYHVYSKDARYIVDARDGTCSCPDAEHNLTADKKCKHQRRVEFATGECGVPADIAHAELDVVLLRRLADSDHPARFGAPLTMNADGHEGDKHVIADGGRENPAPSAFNGFQDCDDCERLPMICATCYISGRPFNASNSQEGEEL